MISVLKKKILNNSKLYRYTVILANFYNIFVNKKSIKGNNNKLEIDPSVYRKKVIIKVSGKNNSITIKEDCRLKNTYLTIVGNNNIITLDSRVNIYESANFYIEGDNSYITLGAKTTVGSSKFFIGEGNTGIKIGSDCMLSRDIAMNTSDFHSILSVETNKRINPPKSIEIKNHVWVGNSAYIAKGAVVGNDCVIASRAYVGGKEFSDNSLLGGIPAKEINEGITWSREKLPY